MYKTVRTRYYRVSPVRPSISCRFDGAGFHHEHHGFLRCSRSVHDAFGNRYALLGIQLDGFIFEIDKKLTFEHKEKFVVVIVLMPMVIAMHDAKADDAVIDFCQG